MNNIALFWSYCSDVNVEDLYAKSIVRVNYISNVFALKDRNSTDFDTQTKIENLKFLLLLWQIFTTDFLTNFVTKYNFVGRGERLKMDFHWYFFRRYEVGVLVAEFVVEWLFCLFFVTLIQLINTLVNFGITLS